jgi:calcineurin-like phosphoesterase family protein
MPAAEEPPPKFPELNFGAPQGAAPSLSRYAGKVPSDEASSFSLPFVNWRFVTPRNYPEKQAGNVYTIKWTPGRPCWIYLPLYNGLSDFAVGVAKGKKIEPLPVRASGVTKPVVFYGSSITHGACASRPGMAFTAIAGRKGDFPVVNLGFSGSAHLEPEVCDMLADIDASCYVIDPLGNVLHAPGQLEARYEKFVRRLHAARPGVPIILAPPGGGAVGRPSPGVAKAHAVFEKLKKESSAEWSRLLQKLNGKIYLILGNHDMRTVGAGFSRLEGVAMQMLINVKGQKIYLNHYPFLCYGGSYRNTWQLYGHVHTSPANRGLDAPRLKMLMPMQYDVGVDNNNYRPVSFEQVKIIIRNQIELSNTSID